MNVTTALFCLASALIANGPPSFADTPTQLVVNGKLISTDVSVQIVNGTAYLPLRATAAALGAELEWIPGKKTAALCVDKSCHYIRPNDPGIGARLVNGRIMLPFRKTAQLLGCKVSWDEKTRLVKVTTSKANFRAMTGRRRATGSSAAYGLSDPICGSSAHYLRVRVQGPSAAVVV